MFLRPKYNGEVNFDWSASSDPTFEKVSAQHTMDWKLALSFIMMSSSFSIDHYFCINNKQACFLKVLSNSKRVMVFFVKGQLISECPFWNFKISKIPQKIWQISALESKKWSNHKIKALFYNTYDQICYLMY